MACMMMESQHVALSSAAFVRFGCQHDIRDGRTRTGGAQQHASCAWHH